MLLRNDFLISSLDIDKGVVVVILRYNLIPFEMFKKAPYSLCFSKNHCLVLYTWMFMTLVNWLSVYGVYLLDFFTLTILVLPFLPIDIFSQNINKFFLTEKYAFISNTWLYLLPWKIFYIASNIFNNAPTEKLSSCAKNLQKRADIYWFKIRFCIKFSIEIT